MSRIRPLLADDWPLYRSLRLRALRDSPDAFGSTFAAEAQRTDADWQARAHQAAARASDAAWFALTDLGPASAHGVGHAHSANNITTARSIAITFFIFLSSS